MKDMQLSIEAAINDDQNEVVAWSHPKQIKVKGTDWNGHKLIVMVELEITHNEMANPHAQELAIPKVSVFDPTTFKFNDQIGGQGQTGEIQ